MWLDKLENMSIILNAEEGMSKIFFKINWNVELGSLDDFEKDFEKLRVDIKELKNML